VAITGMMRFGCFMIFSPSHTNLKESAHLLNSLSGLIMGLDIKKSLTVYPSILVRL